MHRIRQSLAIVGVLGTFVAVPASTLADTTGGPTAPDGMNVNKQTIVCHHNSSPNGAVTVINKNGTNVNGSGDSSCGTG